MAKVAVTGGAGFIGSNLVRILNEQNHEITVIDDLSTGLRSNLDGQNVTFHQISITDRDLLKSALKDVEVVIHLAARGSVPRSVKDPIATHWVNTVGTLNILEICREQNAHLIFSSSSSVYGANLSLPKNEKMWMQPLSPYAASKLSAEAFVSAYSSTYDLKTTSLRFFNVFGPRQRPDHEYAAVLPKWIWKILHKEPIELHGDGTQTRDFTYIDTVCDVIKYAISEKVCGPEVINLAYGNNISLNEVLEKLRERTGSIEVRNMPTRVGDVKDSQNDPTFIKSLFPNIQPVNFDFAFEKTFEWLQSQANK